MNTNETGREPTEPTDARCKARRRGRFERCELEAGHEYGHRAGSWGWVSVEDTVPVARPIPDTPAPDEVAQLRAEVSRLRQGLWDCFAAAGGDTDGDKTPEAVTSDMVSLTLDTVRETRKDDKDEIAALTARIADLEREVADRNSDYINDSATLAEISAENTAIRAKCSDLERENAALGAKLARVKGQRDLLLNGVILMGDNFAEESASETTKQAWKMLRDAVSAGKEAPDA